jgi:uncharacterized protein DUF4129
VVTGAAILAATQAHGPVLRALSAGAPPIGRGAAQRLARAELAKPVYHPQPPLTERVLHAVATWLGRLFRAAQGLPGGWWAAVTLVAVGAGVVAVVLARIGPVARAQRRARELAAPGGTLSAGDHRAAAGRLAEAGDFGGAICEAVRAIAAELDERGVLRPRTGRTADEFAAEAGQALPRLSADLRGAALLFDEVRYGQRAGTRPGYQRVAELDARISSGAGRPGRGGAPPGPAAAATADGPLP